MLLVAECVACGGVLQADSSRDIAAVAAFDILSVVGVHLEDSAQTLSVALDRVEYGRTCVNLT